MLEYWDIERGLLRIYTVSNFQNFLKIARVLRRAQFARDKPLVAWAVMRLTIYYMTERWERAS